MKKRYLSHAKEGLPSLSFPLPLSTSLSIALLHQIPSTVPCLELELELTHTYSSFKHQRHLGLVYCGARDQNSNP